MGLTEEAQDREIEHALVKHVTKFLLELGAGFAFVGRQVMLDVGGDEFFIDLLATLYDVSVPAINQHLKRIFADNELKEAAVMKH